MTIVRPGGTPKGFRRNDFKITQNESQTKKSFSMQIQITRVNKVGNLGGGYSVVTGKSVWDQARKREEE